MCAFEQRGQAQIALSSGTKHLNHCAIGRIAALAVVCIARAGAFSLTVCVCARVLARRRNRPSVRLPRIRGTCQGVKRLYNRNTIPVCLPRASPSAASRFGVKNKSVRGRVIRAFRYDRRCRGVQGGRSTATDTVLPGSGALCTVGRWLPGTMGMRRKRRLTLRLLPDARRTTLRGLERRVGAFFLIGPRFGHPFLTGGPIRARPRAPRGGRRRERMGRVGEARSRRATDARRVRRQREKPKTRRRRCGAVGTRSRSHCRRGVRSGDTWSDTWRMCGRGHMSVVWRTGRRGLAAVAGLATCRVVGTP